MLSKFGRCAFVLACSLSFSCAAKVGAYGVVKVPEDGQQQCDAQCSTMGMSTGAVVIMANVVGCVCEPAEDASASETDRSDQTVDSALAGGMAAIVLQRAQQQQQQQQQ